MSLTRVFTVVIPGALVLTALIYTGVWQLVPLFIWQHPMLTWIPALVTAVVGLGVGAVRAMTSAGDAPSPLAPPPDADLAATVGPVGAPIPTKPPARPKLMRWGPGLLAGFPVLLIGIYFTVISPPATGLDDFEYTVVDTLPERTQPRLLPRTSVDDDPSFVEAKEVHLVRDPETGELIWTGEWRASTLSGPSAGLAVKSLDDLFTPSEILEAGFDHSVAGISPSTIKWEAKLMHPFSRIQYPVLIPLSETEAIAMAPYMGYEGFPFRHPYLAGVLVFHQDGTIEDLTPEEAAEREELALSGRIIPEKVARWQADALSRSEEFKGDIVDGEGNKQPFLTSISEEKTVWVTIINSEERTGGVRAIVMTDSTTGATEVWEPDEGQHLISTEDALNRGRALPLEFTERRCCDSDGHSYTVTLREVVEPRLAFKDGKPYYLVTVVPTDELFGVQREIELTLLIDAETGETLDQFNHETGGAVEDARLQAFFTGEKAPKPVEEEDPFADLFE